MFLVVGPDKTVVCVCKQPMCIGQHLLNTVTSHLCSGKELSWCPAYAQEREMALVHLG